MLALVAFVLGILFNVHIVNAAPVRMDELPSDRIGDLVQVTKSWTLAQSAPVTVTIHTTIDASSSIYPFVTTIITGTVPASWPEIREMRSHGLDEGEYLDSYINLLQRFADDGLNFDIRSSSPIDILRRAPSIAIQDQRAFLVFRSSEYVNNHNILFYQQPDKSGLIIRPAVPIGREAQIFAPRDIVIAISHANRTFSGESIPLSMTHQIEMELNGLQVISASPLPRRDDGANLVWVFPAGEAAQNVEVRVRPSLGTSLFYWTSMGFAIRPLYLLPGLLRSTSLAAAFITALFLLRRLPKNQMLSGLSRAAADLRHAVIWALALTFGVQLIFFILQLFSLRLNRFINLPTLFLYILLLIFWYQSGPDSRRRKLFAGIFTVVLFLPSASLILLSIYFSSFMDNLLLVLIAGWSLMAFLTLGLITFLFLSGIFNFITAYPSRDRSHWLPIWERIKSRGVTWISAAIFSLSFLIVIFWLAYQIENLGGNLLVNYSLNNPENIQEVWFSIIAEVRDASEDFAQVMLSSASTLLPFFLLAGVVGLLFELSKTSKDVRFSAAEGWALGFVTLLFATFVVGMRGEILGLRIPTAFLLTLWILHKSLVDRVGLAEQELRTINLGSKNGEPLLLSHRKELLLRVRALETLDRQQLALYEEHTSGKIDEMAYEAKLSELNIEKERLTFGEGPGEHSGALSPASSAWPVRLLLSWKNFFFHTNRPPVEIRKPSAHLLLTEEFPPSRFALSLGPGMNWWENGSIGVDVGWKLALFPIGFYLYVLFSKNALVWLSPQTNFGVFLLLSGLFNEIVFWLTAAFVLGCIYPYLPGNNGVIKGAFLAGVWLASMLVVEWIGLRGEFDWVFRFLQLLLFLTLLGAAIDLQTLHKNGIYWRFILDYYQLRNLKIVIGYLSPLMLALIAIAQQVLSGQAMQAITEIIKNLPQTIPLF